MNRFQTALTSTLLATLVGMSFPASADAPSPALQLAQQLNHAFIEVAEQVSPAVVVITVVQKRSGRSQNPGESTPELAPPELHRRFDDHGGVQSTPRKRSSGSGIVITEDGYILTNNHVVENAEKIRVRFQNGQEYDAAIQGVDPESDIAVLKIKASGLTPAKLGDSDKTRVGEFAIAIGAPFDLNYSVTVGHVSAKGRSFSELETYTDQDFIQTDASINPGNSGGPLVNLSSEVIGINSLVRPNSGIGFAIPINLAKRVKDHLIQKGRFVRSWIGIRIVELKDCPAYRDLDPSLAPDATDGVVIDEIDGNSPASKSKLKAGDVVVGVDGVPIKTTRQLKDEVASKKSGQRVKVSVVRGREHLDIPVTAETLPSDAAASSATGTEGSPESPDYGLKLETLTKKLAEETNVEMVPGLLITTVDPGSSAYEQAIKVGDIITEINRKPVASVKQFREILKKADPRRPVLFNIVSDGSSRIVVLKSDD